MTKEEMAQCDLEQMPMKQCTSDKEERQVKDYINKVLTSGEADGKPPHPGDMDWVERSCDPRPPNKVYVI
jgi:hypothetical protein